MKGTRSIVMGLGRHGGGVAAARWLASQGSHVTVTDLAAAAQLADSLTLLSEVPIARYALGGHDEADFRGAPLVIVNPAVRPDHALLKLARQQGSTLSSETELFLEHCPAPVIGVTGTTGKSTTCAMLAEILRQAGCCTWLGGNIGRSLLGDLECIQPSDIVVLELSSFQLAHLSATARLPQFAVVTNCSPNHLDWHRNWNDYRGSKQRLLAGGGDQRIVLNAFDPEVATWQALAAGRCLPLGEEAALPALRVPGKHNRQNALLAASVARYLQLNEQAIQRGLTGFTGLPHRQQYVGTTAGRRFYNDSKATSPAATIAVLSAIEGPLWLLAGGADTGSDWTQLAAAITRRAAGAVLFGAARASLLAAIRQGDEHFPVVAVETLADALAGALQSSRPGDTILLSPACPSFDQFTDYAERGRSFETLLGVLADASCASAGNSAGT